MTQFYGFFPHLYEAEVFYETKHHDHVKLYLAASVLCSVLLQEASCSALIMEMKGVLMSSCV